MPSTNEVLNTAGDIIWDMCRLYNASGYYLDMLGLVYEMNIFEDIFAYTMYGNAVIVDTNNVIGTFPIIGQEKLIVSFHTPTREPRKKAFRVLKVSEKRIEGNRQIYKIHFVSYDGFLDMCYTENRAIRGTSTPMIEQLHDTMWKSFDLDQTFIDEYKPKHFFKDSQNPLVLVSPQWSPMECIQWITKRALNIRNKADYLYFETMKGVHSLSLTEHLFAQNSLFEKNDNANMADYVVSQTQSQITPTGDIDLDRMYGKVHDIRYITISDQMIQMMNRAYGQQVYDHNIFNKKITFPVQTMKDVINDDNYMFMNDYPIVLQNDKDWKIAKDAYTTVSHSYPYRFNNFANDNEGIVTNTRLPAMNKLEYQKVDLDVWGRSDLNVGNKIFLYVGEFNSNPTDMTDGFDAVNSALYLITAICHRLAPTQHKMTMQCIRESSKAEIKPK